MDRVDIEKSIKRTHRVAWSLIPVIVIVNIAIIGVGIWALIRVVQWLTG